MDQATLIKKKTLDYEHYKLTTVRGYNDCGKLQRCKKVEVVNK